MNSTPDISRAAGVVVSDSAARELVSALDMLDRLAAPTGQRLSPQIALIRRELATCTSRVPASADASVEAIVAQQVAQFEASVVDTTTAARVLGITRDGVTWLCRNRHIQAIRSGGRWWIPVDSLADYRDRRGRTQEA